jgi:hypothetical protein
MNKQCEKISWYFVLPEAECIVTANLSMVLVKYFKITERATSPSAGVRFSWHHENRTHSDVPERSKHNYTRVCGRRPHLHELRHIRHFTHNQLYPTEFNRITFFSPRPSKTIMKLLKMAASVRFMKLMALH